MCHGAGSASLLHHQQSLLKLAQFFNTLSNTSNIHARIVQAEPKQTNYSIYPSFVSIF